MEFNLIDPNTAFDKFMISVGIGLVSIPLVFIAAYYYDKTKLLTAIIGGASTFFLFLYVGYESNLNKFYKITKSEHKIILNYVFPEDKLVYLPLDSKVRKSGRNRCQINIYSAGDKYSGSEILFRECEYIINSLKKM